MATKLISTVKIAPKLVTLIFVSILNMKYSLSESFKHLDLGRSASLLLSVIVLSVQDDQTGWYHFENHTNNLSVRRKRVFM